MTVGTKSLILGAHCLLIHPFMVALAWWKLYGFPFDPRLLLCFVLHDLGYWGLGNMDGPEGSLHPFRGARIMHWLFDRPDWIPDGANGWRVNDRWYVFCLGHSRHLARELGMNFSRLCVADKLSFAMTPEWLYLLMARLTGELDEYMERGMKRVVESRAAGRVKTREGRLISDALAAGDERLWFRAVGAYLRRWAWENRDNAAPLVRQEERKAA